MDSPCIDSGVFIASVTYDFVGNLRGFDGSSLTLVDGSDYDIGAYEYVGSATSTPTPTTAQSTFTPTPINNTPTITPTYLPGDFDENHLVDTIDLLEIICSGNNQDSNCAMTGDTQIDYKDISLFSIWWQNQQF